MCGIVGYWTAKGSRDVALLKGMQNGVAHRGPDGAGQWFWPTGFDKAHHLAFGHHLFAIMDNRAVSAQPMHRSGFTLAFNGEIYNHKELHTQLAALGVSFHGHTDTEVLLQAWRMWGVDCLPKLRGFFAFALFDASSHELWLIRDAIGKAPLYLIQKPDFLCFASDIKPLFLACPTEKTSLRESAIHDYLHLGRRDFGHHTFWQNINSLPAGSWLKVQVQTGQTSAGRWWQLPAQRCTVDDLSLEEAVKGLHTRLHEAVALRMTSARKIGFTLSGGLDSSALLAIACQHLPTGEKLPLLTTGYQDKTQDETRFARLVSQHYAHQTEHHVLDGFDRTVLEDWDRFLDLQEEPFHDPVLYTDYLQQKYFKSIGVDVCITGAGGDEVLAGYPSFLLAHARGLWQDHHISHLPEVMRDLFMLTCNFSIREWLGFVDKNRFPTTQLFVNESSALPLPKDLHTQLLQKMGDFQMNYWLRSLQKTYMSIPVEPRLPLLDQSVVEYCMRLPLNYLIHKGWPKYILRKAVEPLLPKEVVWRRKKMGFPFDTGQWLIQNDSAVLDKLSGTESNPWLNTSFIRTHFHKMAHAHPQLLWRTVCFLSWWKKIQVNHDGPK